MNIDGTHVFRFLRNSGTNNASVNGAPSPVNFRWAAPRRCTIERMIVKIQSQGPLRASSYGSIDGPLLNGVRIGVLSNGDRFDLLDGDSIKANADWSKVCHDVVPFTFGSGDRYISVRWTFSKTGAPLKLDAGDVMLTQIRDDLRALVDHTFMVQGIYV